MSGYKPVESPGAGQQSSRVTDATRSKLRRNCHYIVGAVAIVLLIFVPFCFSPANWHSPQLSLKDWQQGRYQPHFRQIDWLADGVDGEYIGRDGSGGFVLARWESSETKKIVDSHVMLNGTETAIEAIVLNKDRSLSLLQTNRQKHWRHSSYSHYWLLDVETGVSSPLVPAKPNAKVSVALWSPRGDSIAFVLDSDVYVRDTKSDHITRVTKDGGPNIFNGIPDWVYEEEVFGGPEALWWSTDGSSLAYLRSNNTEVPEFPVPYFLSNDGGVTAYPDLVKIKYPKPGYKNPEAGVWIYNVGAKTSKEVKLEPLEDMIVTECVWAGDQQLLVKTMSRDSDILQVNLVDAGTGASQVTRRYDSVADGGWYEITHNTIFVPSDAGNSRPELGYIDTLIVDGYNHIGYFSPLNASEPHVLTHGEWEVVDTDYAVNLKTNMVYFTATKESSIEQHIYEVPLVPAAVPHGETTERMDNITRITPAKESFYGAKYSGDASHMVLTYHGPGVPQQRVVTSGDIYEHGHVLEDNKELAELLGSLTLGEIVYGELDVGDEVKVNYREIRPSGFSEYRKHPLLFFNYGGPGSQQVMRRFTLDYQRVFAETHNAVVVTVDPRGTGFRGRKFRSVVRDQLGHYEAHDVIEVAKHFNARRYIDESTTAIWGWSYGGYLTLKTLETDGGDTFKYGVAVAPVTDWRLYDSIYTERYMHTPEKNPEGYKNSAITNVDSLSKVQRFLIMHGTGDDNVHFQNTLALLDKLDLGGVENFDIHVFPDSDHSISFHNAYPFVFDRLDSWLHKAQARAGN